MKKAIMLISLLCLIMTLTACNNKDDSEPVVYEQRLENKEELLAKGRELWEKLHYIETEETDINLYKDAVVRYILNPGKYLDNSEFFPIYKDVSFEYLEEDVLRSVTGSYWYDAVVITKVFNTEIQQREELKKKIMLEFVYDQYNQLYKIKYADIQFLEKLK